MIVENIHKTNSNVKTINDHLDRCNSNEKDFRSVYTTRHMTDEMRDNLSNGIRGVVTYNNDVRDNTLLSNEEFCSLVGFLSIREYKQEVVKMFIKTLKLLEIEDDKEIPYIIAMNYHEVYFGLERNLSHVKTMINNIRIWSANREQKLILFDKFLDKQKKLAKEKMNREISRIESYCKTHVHIPGYKYLLLDILAKLNYEGDIILGHMPDPNLILKDYMTVKEDYVSPESFRLIALYFLDKETYNKIPNSLGNYKIQGVGNKKVPFTKKEFEKSMTDEVSKENAKLLIRKRINYFN